MKLGMVQYDGVSKLVAITSRGTVDLSGIAECSLMESIRNWTVLEPKLRAAVEHAPLLPDNVHWTAPLPNPGKFLLLAGNFRAHVVESGFEAAPDENLTPQFFMKPSSTIIGPYDDIPLTARNHALDYESEVAVVIGSRIRNASLDTALDAVWGYTVVNDISERRLNEGMPDRKKRSNDDFYDWLVGKWFDGSAPMGPWVVTADAMEQDPIVTAHLNGESVQAGPLSLMIHSVAEAIVYISSVLTLEPGDVISMGTPSGVGMARNRLLRDGDVIECGVSGIGSLRNTVRSV